MNNINLVQVILVGMEIREEQLDAFLWENIEILDQKLIAVNGGFALNVVMGIKSFANITLMSFLVVLITGIIIVSRDNYLALFYIEVFDEIW